MPVHLVMSKQPISDSGLQTAKENVRGLDGLRNREPQQLKEMYQRFFPAIAQHVRQRGGNEEDAQDVFQDSMIVLFRKLKDPEFVLTSQMGTFLFAIAKRVWLKQASRRVKRPETVLDQEPLELAEPQDIEAELVITERNRFFREKLKELGDGCQKLLKLFFAGTSMVQIAEKMGFASDSYAKKRKFQCKQQLTKLIQADPRFSEISNQAS